MNGLLALLWLAGTIAGIVFLIKPRPQWPPVANRKRAAISLAVVFVGLPILAAIVAPSSGGSASQPAKPKTPAELAAQAAAEAKAKAEAELKAMRESPEKYLALDRTRGVSGGFGAVFILGGAVTNTGKVAYKDPVVRCEVFSETDTSLGHVDGRLYKAVPPGKTVRFSEFNMGFVDSDWKKYACEITGATVVEGADKPDA